MNTKHRSNTGEGMHRRQGLGYFFVPTIDLCGNVSTVDVGQNQADWEEMIEAQSGEFGPVADSPGETLHHISAARWMHRDKWKALKARVEEVRLANLRKPMAHREWLEANFWKFLDDDLASEAAAAYPNATGRTTTEILRSEMERRRRLNKARIDQNRSTKGGRDAAIERASEAAEKAAHASANLGASLGASLEKIAELVAAKLGLGTPAAPPSPAAAEEPASSSTNPKASAKKGA